MALRLHAKLDSDLTNEIDGTQTGAFAGAGDDPTYQSDYGPGGTPYLRMDGGDEGDKIVVFPEKAATKITGSLTVSIWCKTSQTFPGAPATDAQKEMVTRTGGNFSFGWEEDNVEHFVWLRCFLRRSSDNAYEETEHRDDNPQPGYRDGDWHHYLIRFQPSSDGVTADGLFNMWADGVEVDNEDGHTLDDLKASGVADEWCIGGRKGSGPTYSRNLDADLDELRVYDEYVDNATIAVLAASAPPDSDPFNKNTVYQYYLKD